MGVLVGVSALPLLRPALTELKEIREIRKAQRQNIHEPIKYDTMSED